MPALLTQHILPDPGSWWGRRKQAGNRKAEIKPISIGRTTVSHLDLGLPFGLSEKAYQKECHRAFRQLAEAGEKFAVLPKALEEQGRAYGLQACSDLPALRRLAADAALDCLGQRAELGAVRIFARMPSREIIDCMEVLAESCRYVSVSGGEWSKRAARRLLQEYGTAAPGPCDGVQQVVLAFDAGVDRRVGETVIDLTREGLRGDGGIRPKLGAALELTGLPHERIYDRSALLGHLYIHGGLDRAVLRVWCKCLTDRPKVDYNIMNCVSK